MKKVSTSLLFDGHSYNVEALLEDTKITIVAVKKPQLARYESQGDYGHVKTYHQIDKAFTNPDQNVVSYSLHRVNEQTLKFVVEIPALEIVDEFLLRERQFEPTVEVLKKRVEQLEWEVSESKKIIVELETKINEKQVQAKKEMEVRLVELENKFLEQIRKNAEQQFKLQSELEQRQNQRQDLIRLSVEHLEKDVKVKIDEREQKTLQEVDKRQKKIDEKIVKEAQKVDTKISSVKSEIEQVQKSFQAKSEEHNIRHGQERDQIRKEIQTALEWTERSMPFPNSNLVTAFHAEYLVKWYEGPTKSWKIIYRASTDGFKAKDFHDKCDNIGETFTMIKTTNGSLFGGYTPIPWTSGGGAKWDPNTFLFSLRSASRKDPVKMKNDGSYSANTYSIYCLKKAGPTFGGGCDICIANNSNVNTQSLSNFGHSFTLNGYVYDTEEAKSFLAGSLYFQVSEIEVFAPAK
jgi:hypothetical protein